MSCQLRIVQRAWKGCFGTVIMNPLVRLKQNQVNLHHKKENMCCTFYDLKVCNQSPLKNGVPEQTTLGDLTHQELHDNGKFMYSLIKSRRSLCGGSAPDGLLEICMGFAVVQLNSLDTTQIVMKPG